jgi:secondary thiamine-phosphate synthase enzyme
VVTFQKNFRLSTKGHCDVRDITTQVESVVTASKVRTGMVNVAGLGSTLGITTIEFEPGAVSDLRRSLETIAPSNDDYAHNARWGDHNGFAHLRSALLGASETLPVREGHVYLGTWQQIVLCDFDDRPREREITVTVLGE